MYASIQHAFDQEHKRIKLFSIRHFILKHQERRHHCYDRRHRETFVRVTCCGK
jgi:hypothetical protein